MVSGTELPPAVAERARRHRARLDSRGVRLDAGGRNGPDLDQIDETTSSVLLVAALPDNARRLAHVLTELRSRIGPDTSVRVVEPSRPLIRSRAGRVADRVRKSRTATPDRPDVAMALRKAGFTVTAIERFGADDERPNDLWVDLVAIDLGPGSTPTD